MALLVELLSVEALEQIAAASENFGEVEDRATVIAARAELAQRIAAARGGNEVTQCPEETRTGTPTSVRPPTY